ncbi:MAG: cytochrome C oxidase subunit IV family protein [Bacteroidetes bacterium]|nr:cytochrome C oxidase subunit IV family protein [Bacteroidota bacterium]
MSEFHDDYPNYEAMAHHSEEEGAVKRKKLWKVFWIMLGITIIELIIGFMAKDWHLLDDRNKSTLLLKVLFIGFTIAKAAYIVLSFMHLGDERKVFKYTILAPYCLFITYLIWIVTTEGTYSSSTERKSAMDQNVIDQQEMLLKGGHGEEHGATEKHTDEKEKSHEGH